MAIKKKQDFEGERALAEVLFNSIGDGAVTTDEYGRITRINPAAQAIIGYSEKEAIGQWLPRIFEAYDDNNEPISLIERPVTRAFVSGNVISERTIYKHKSGKLVPIAMTISPIMVKNVPIGCIEIFRDITQEYEVDKMKSDFISLASHQLRTPLSAIKTYAHMLLDGFMGQLTKPQIKSLKTIVSASNRMNETISTLLNITRIESGSVVVTKKPVSVASVIEEVVNEHRLTANDKNISCRIDRPKDSIKIISDGVVLKEIFSNLVSNAIKYTPVGGNVTIALKTTGSLVVVSIKDTGVGIPEESRDNVFTKFFRADNVIRQETSGIGLGLYLVKGLINELGGDVWFDSKVNEGSIFYVSLPLLPHTINTHTVKK